MRLIFYHLVRRSHFDLQKIFFRLGRWKKKIYYIFWAFIQKKIIIPVSFHSKDFVLLYKFEKSWSLLRGLSRSFFALSGASNLRFPWTCSSLGLLTVVAFFKTILASLFRTLGLPLRVMSLKPSFLEDHFTTQHSDFSSFLVVSFTIHLSTVGWNERWGVFFYYSV